MVNYEYRLIRLMQLFSRIPDIYNENGEDIEISFVGTSENTFLMH